MSENDRELISKAFLCDDWGLISYLEEKAESEECKDILHIRKGNLFDKEENS